MALGRKQFIAINNVQLEDCCTGTSAHEWYKAKHCEAGASWDLTVLA